MSKIKRRITKEQLEELTERQKVRLREWWIPEVGDVFYHPTTDSIDAIEGLNDGILRLFPGTGMYPLIDIGQMLELLEKLNAAAVKCESASTACDALWDAVKKAL